MAAARARGIPLLKRDGTLKAGILAGALFALEFLLIYRGLLWTTATRGVLFLYLAPFFVVIGSRWLVPGDHFHASQWLGLLLSLPILALAESIGRDAKNINGELEKAVTNTAPLGALRTTIEYATTIIGGLQRGRARLGG